MVFSWINYKLFFLFLSTKFLKLEFLRIFPGDDLIFFNLIIANGQVKLIEVFGISILKTIKLHPFLKIGKIFFNERTIFEK